MLEEDIDPSIKVVVVGNGGVGKSSLIERFGKGSFSKTYKKTIGVDFMEKRIRVNDRLATLMLWDTAGQEEYDAITRAYYRGAQVCILVFSTTDKTSFLDIQKWKAKVEEEVNDVVLVLVQNKIDILDQAAMSHEEVNEMAKKLKLKFFRVSVKENFNVQEVFQYVTLKYFEKLEKMRKANLVTIQSTKKIGMRATTKEFTEETDHPFNLDNKLQKRKSKCSLL